jgi:hypothetical protein
MRSISSVLLIGVLIAAAIVLYLQTERATTGLEAVEQVAVQLREEGVEGIAFDHAGAAQMAEALQMLVDAPDRITDHVADLRTFGETAAAWARQAPAPSPELRAAVALRGAASELRSYALDNDAGHLARARQELDRARAGLAGEPASGTAATEAVRQQLDNLQRSQQEQIQRLDEELQR